MNSSSSQSELGASLEVEVVVVVRGTRERLEVATGGAALVPAGAGETKVATAGEVVVRRVELVARRGVEVVSRGVAEVVARRGVQVVTRRVELTGGHVVSKIGVFNEVEG